ncbi:unnamed protein product [Owenia fusiformis]|uniref:28S ribosomal protein S28, mitochondrial n=1 Tax=Owenia fusiformis TaxID=6347 RepID=A0A8S4PJG1_OWEFU|nr:unnamed protein product [Owenia fusiformis]
MANLLKIWRIAYSANIRTAIFSCSHGYTSSSVQDASGNQAKPSGFTKSKTFQLLGQQMNEANLPDNDVEEKESFATMLRHSKLMQLGNPESRMLIGTIINLIDDDLYIDFGGKFPCVCKVPAVRSNEYTLGRKVRLKLLDLELSSKFLGATKDVTLLEADAVLIGLYFPPVYKE